MEINFEDLIQHMLNAAKSALNKQWKEAKPLAETQFRLFTQNIQMIAELKLRGEISEEQAKLQMNIQRNAIQIVLLTIEGLGIIAVEEAINKAIDIIRDVVNKVIGWTIL